MKNFFNKFHTDIIYSTANKFRRFIKLGKDKCKTGENTNVVYRIDCNDCETSYVGQTGWEDQEDSLKYHPLNASKKWEFF